jgi:hypothetical protein
MRLSLLHELMVASNVWRTANNLHLVQGITLGQATRRRIAVFQPHGVAAVIGFSVTARRTIRRSLCVGEGAVEQFDGATIWHSRKNYKEMFKGKNQTGFKRKEKTRGGVKKSLGRVSSKLVFTYVGRHAYPNRAWANYAFPIQTFLWPTGKAELQSGRSAKNFGTGYVEEFLQEMSQKLREVLER